MELRFSATMLQNGNMDAAYIEVPYDIEELFGKGRLLVNAAFKSRAITVAQNRRRLMNTS